MLQLKQRAINSWLLFEAHHCRFWSCYTIGAIGFIIGAGLCTIGNYTNYWISMFLGFWAGIIWGHFAKVATKRWRRDKIRKEEDIKNWKWLTDNSYAMSILGTEDLPSVGIRPEVKEYWRKEKKLRECKNCSHAPHGEECNFGAWVNMDKGSNDWKYKCLCKKYEKK